MITHMFTTDTDRMPVATANFTNAWPQVVGSRGETQRLPIILDLHLDFGQALQYLRITRLYPQSTLQQSCRLVVIAFGFSGSGVRQKFLYRRILQRKNLGPSEGP